MKNAMRNAITLILVSLVASLMVIACANPMSAEEEVIGNGGGLFTVTIGGGTARTIVTWANTLDSSRLTHTITVSGGTGGPFTGTIPTGGGTVPFSVTPGQWTISVEARYSGEVIAVGSKTVQIKNGDNGTILIKMNEPPNYPSYTVSFNSNGGSRVDNQTVKKYSRARSETPTRNDNVFGGWYSDSGLTRSYDFGTAVTGDITLYAKWGQTAPTLITYDVTYGKDGNYGVFSFIFSAPVSGLTRSEINITAIKGNGSVTFVSLEGSGISWKWTGYVSDITEVSVSISKDGIESGTKTVTVGGEAKPTIITYNVFYVKDDKIYGDGVFNFTFSAPVSVLTADDININIVATQGTNGSVTKENLTGSGISWYLEVKLPGCQGDTSFSVSISKDGIESRTETVLVHL